MTTVFDAIIRENLKSQRASIQEVMARSRMFDADAVAIDGRMIRVGDHWLADFASCNYLGLDLDDDVIASIEPALREWGVHPSWCRLVASPHLYTRCEEALAELLGAEDFLILPTVTLCHLGVIPALVGKDGLVLLDKFAHMTMYQAAKITRDSGCSLASFPQNDYARLEELLHEHRATTKKLILVDGVYSMTGRYLDLPRVVALAKQYDAAVYVDDAHGFGVVGEHPTPARPYGVRGNGIVRHFGLGYEDDHVMYVGGFSKSLSSLAAGVTCSRATKAFLKAYATPYDLSGPCPTASLASLLAGLAINATRGDALRDKLHALTMRAIAGLRALGFEVDNDTGFPIISVWCGDNERLIAASRILFDAGVLLTLGPYPMIPKGKEELRITVTSANTEEQVDAHLLVGFAKVREYLLSIGAPLRPER